MPQTIGRRKGLGPHHRCPPHTALRMPSLRYSPLTPHFPHKLCGAWIKATIEDIYLRACLPKLGKWLRVWSLSAFWCQTWRQKTMPYMALCNPSIDYSMSCLALFFWRHFWRQKAAIICTTNHLPNSGLWVLILGFGVALWGFSEPEVTLFGFPPFLKKELKDIRKDKKRNL